MTFANHDEIFDAITEFPDLAFLDARRPWVLPHSGLPRTLRSATPEHAVIEKNPHYWGPLPDVDYVVFVDLVNSTPSEIELGN